MHAKLASHEVSVSLLDNPHFHTETGPPRWCACTPVVLETVRKCTSIDFHAVLTRISVCPGTLSMLCRQGSVRLQEQEVVEKATQTGSFLTTDQDIPAMVAKLVYRLVEALDESTRG